jgi:hypothetical protein
MTRGDKTVLIKMESSLPDWIKAVIERVEEQARKIGLEWQSEDGKSEGVNTVRNGS